MWVAGGQLKGADVDDLVRQAAPRLRAAVLLVDLRRGAELDETELKAFLEGPGRRVIVVGTKADKLAKHERKPAAERLRKALAAPVITVSAEQGEGVDELWKRLLVAVAEPAA